MQGRHSKAGSEIDNIHKKQYLGNEEQGWGWKGHKFGDGPEFVLCYPLVGNNSDDR